MQRRANHRTEDAGFIPPQVENLAKRERELAITIYLEGAMTAKALEGRLDRDLSNSSLRSMLGRLCQKGILVRRKINGSHMTTDRRIPYLYFPAITPEQVRTTMLRQFADDYFEGSLLQIAETTIRLLNDEMAPSGSAISAKRRCDPRRGSSESRWTLACVQAAPNAVRLSAVR